MSTFKISSTDNQADYAEEKLTAGNGITITKTSSGGYETLEISADAQVTPSTNATDVKVAVTASDTNESYLSDKLVAGNNITLSVVSNGGDETIRIDGLDPIDFSGISFTDGYNLKVSTDDTNPGFLSSKLVAGNNVTLTVINDGGDETLRVDILDGAFDEALQELVDSIELDIEAHQNEQNAINDTIIKELDGYAQNSTVTEHYNQLSQNINDIVSVIDGYATDTDLANLNNTVTQHYNQLGQNINDIVSVIDGYATDTELSAFETTFQENKNAQFQINQSIRQSLDGYATVNDTAATGDGYLAFFTSTGRNIAGDEDLFYDRVNARLGVNTTAPQTSLHIKGADGAVAGAYGPYASGLYVENNDFAGITLTSGDAKQARLVFTNGATNQAELYLDPAGPELIMYGPDGNSFMTMSAAGVGVNTDGGSSEFNVDGSICLAGQVATPSTEAGWGKIYTDYVTGELKFKDSSGNVHILTDKIGNLTFQENKNAQFQINQSILQSLDGYAQNLTVEEHKAAQYQINQSILQALDGYALAAVVGVSDTTFQENKNAQQQVNQSILQSLDGYALSVDLVGLNVTVQENKNAQQQVNQSILQALDGYQIALGEVVSELTFQQNKNAQQQINQSILQSLDGYATPLGFVSELTFQENKNAQYQINQSIIQAIDGYTAINQFKFKAYIDGSPLVDPDIVTGAAVAGDKFIIDCNLDGSDGASGVGINGWTGHDYPEIAVYDGAGWSFYTPQINDIFFIAGWSGIINLMYVYNGTSYTRVNRFARHIFGPGYSVQNVDAGITIDNVGGGLTSNPAIEILSETTDFISFKSSTRETRLYQSSSAFAVTTDTINGGSLLIGESYRHGNPSFTPNGFGVLGIDGTSEITELYINDIDGNIGGALKIGVSNNISLIDTNSFFVFNDGSKIVPCFKTGATTYSELIGVSELTFQENKSYWDSSLESLVQAADAYGLSFSENELTFQENKNAQQQINQSILQSLDGYAQNSTVTEHYNQFNQAIQDITSTIDGYALAANLTGLDLTVQENKAAQQQVNQSIIQVLDGYALSSDLVILNNTVTEHYNQLGLNINDIISVIDGYALDSELATTNNNLAALDLTVQENKSAQQQINQSIVQVLDGYALDVDLTGLELTVEEHKSAQYQVNQSILQALDGYLTSVVGYVSDTTFTENKNAQEQINQSILQALDGYAGGGGVSETTFQENKNAQQQINQTILQSLDGYAGGGGGVSEETFNDFKAQYSQVIQSLRQACDAYGGDGYIYSLKSLPISMAGAGYSLNSSEARTTDNEPVLYYDVAGATYMSGAKFIGTDVTAYYLDWCTAGTAIPADYYSGGIIEIYGFNATAGTQALEPSVSAHRVGVSTGVTAWSVGGSLQAVYTPSKTLCKVYEVDISGQNIIRNDLMQIRLQRNPRDASDTNAGTFYWGGSTFWYIGRDASR